MVMSTRGFTFDVATTVVSHPMGMDRNRLRRLYDWAVTTMTELGKAPNTFEAKGGGSMGRST